MSTYQCYCVLMIIFPFIGVCTNEIRLTPTRVYAKENSSTTLTCSKTNGALLETRWQNSHISGEANLIFYNGKCIATRWLLDSDLFEGVCNGDGTYSLVLKRITRTQHGAEWICKETIQSSINEVVINVYVPATSVTLSQPDKDYMMENQTEKITCNTSACRPDPRVQWYLRNSVTGVIYNLTTFSTQTYVDRDNGLKASKSTLNFKKNRTVNGFLLYCDVWTQSDIADITSREIIVNITYPPNNYPEIHGVEPNIIEADTGTFVCLVAGGNPPALLSWNCFGKSVATFETNGNIVSSTIKWTALRGYNTCSCQAKHLNNWKRITNTTVNVLYPPVKPHFTIGSTIVFGDVRIIRNNTLQVICKSESNPSPNYTWTGTGISSKDGDTLNITSVKMIDEGLYKCNASNRMTRSNNSYIERSISSSFTLTMLYPPSTPKFRFGNNTGQNITSNIFNVVKRDTFTIYCDAKGNPPPNVTWDENNKSPALSISSILSDTKRTCTARNLMKETAKETETYATSSASLSFNVLYPPGIPTINVSNINGETVQGQEKTVSLIELETIYLTCFSKSKPFPTYQWVHDRSPKTQLGNIVTFQNISRDKRGTYSCNVKNVMDRSNGTTQEGKNKSVITLNILYPASVDNIEDNSVAEGSQLKKVCPVLNGNPSNSTVVWSRLIDKNRWNDTFLYIRNVSRTDDSDYTCTVITEMFPTIGNSLIIEKKQSFHLNVFFRPEITTFSLNDSRSENVVVINETENAPLVCIAEANPSSNLTLYNPKGYRISEVSHSNFAHHILLNTTYLNAGEYTCTGRNDYTRDSPARSYMILIVRCPPRPSSGDTRLMKVTTVLYINVTLQFSAWNYLDEPNKTAFIWFKDNDSISDNGSKYIIRTDGLQTNFSIRNTTQHDLGFYRVNVRNSAGEYIHYYDVTVKDKPDTPLDFQVINDSITDKSVTLTWNPGFNGGFQQTFVILYKMKFDTKWLNKSLKDIRNENINYTLYDLTSVQDYEVEMFAKNREGNSAHTERLQFKTKVHNLSSEELTEPENFSSAVNYGITVGLPIVIIILLSIVATWIILKRRSYCQNLRKVFRKKEEHIETVPSNIYQTLTESRTLNNERTDEYEKINMNQQNDDNRVNNSEDMANETESTVTYQNLTKEGGVTNVYCQLHTSIKKEDTTKNYESLQEEKESSIYINLKI